MLDAFMRSWAASLQRARGQLVLPGDAAVITSPGPDPDRVLLVGSGPAAGVGVTSHEEALTGSLARQLTEHSRRGTTVESIGRIDLRLEDIPELLAATRLERFDAVVVTAGMAEAISMIPRKRWAHDLGAVLDAVRGQQARDSAVVVVGMPAPTSTGGGRGWRGALIDRHAAALNRTSRATVSSRPHGHFAQLTGHPHEHGQPTTACYTSWAGEICAVLEPVLSDDGTRPATSRIHSEPGDG